MIDIILEFLLTLNDGSFLVSFCLLLLCFSQHLTIKSTILHTFSLPSFHILSEICIFFFIGGNAIIKPLGKNVKNLLSWSSRRGAVVNESDWEP